MTLTLLLFRWIANKISDILGTEDDVVIELCFNLIEGTRYVSCWNFDTMLARVLLSAADSPLYSLTSSPFRFNSLDFWTRTLRLFAKTYGCCC